MSRLGSNGSGPRAVFAAGLLFANAEVWASAEEVDVYRDLIHPIFEKACIQCHGPEKSKGDLRLDSFEFTMRGGELGDTVVPGDTEASEMVYRLRLEDDDDERMPPEGKPEPSFGQKALIEWWIQTGAPRSGRLEEFAISPEIDGYIRQQLSEPDLIVAEESISAALSWEAVVADVQRLQGDPRMLVRRTALNEPFVSVRASSGSYPFDDDAIKQLSPIAAYAVDLNLSYSAITDDALAAVAEMRNLERLYLQGTDITDIGILHLANLDRLFYLNLSGTSVSDTSLEVLARLDSLKRLFLWGTKVSEGGAAAIRKQLRDEEQEGALQDEISELKRRLEEIRVIVRMGTESD